MSQTAPQKKSKLRLIITIALVAVLIVGCAWAVKQDIIDPANRRANASTVQSLYPGASTTDDTAEDTAEDAAEGTAEESTADGKKAVTLTTHKGPVKPAARKSAAPETEQVLQYDFYELYQYNPDIVGWIEVGTHLSMPVVYRDNEFYLTHDYYGNPDKAGTLFINEANTIWPQDANLLFHGHNMRDGSIFGDLDDYRTVDYLKDNIIVTFRTIYDEEPTNYVIFSLFDASMNAGAGSYFDAGYINFDDSDEFNEYTGEVLRRNYFNMPYGVQEGDHMLTLFTCSYSNDNGRFMIYCRELREDETVESIMEQAQTITKK